MMRATMQQGELCVAAIIRHGTTVHPRRSVVTLGPGGHTRAATFADVGARAAQLAHALGGLGVGEGDRVGTLMWNNQEHVEAYLAVPGMGAVLHTLNLRIGDEQLAHVVGHAADRVVIVDGSLVGLLARILPGCDTVEAVVVTGDADTGPLAPAGRAVHRYEDLLAGRPARFEWPEVDETAAAALCYTSGTTGPPKGVAYSHRSIFLHSLAALAKDGLQFGADDRVLAIVPQFHANAWGSIHAALLAGSDLLLPDRFLQPEPLVALISTHRPTIALAVPTIWAEVAAYLDAHPGHDISSLELVAVGGSAVPRHLMEAFDRRGVPIVQAWGMTETSPLAAIARAPRAATGEDRWAVRTSQGRPVPGVEARIVDDLGEVLPHDGAATGELEVRGPWVTGSYHLDAAPERFDAGWLRTGDIARIDRDQYITITDRAKDIVKSGGEWISSVELELLIASHPDVAEASVIGVPDPKWQERPLAVVVLRAGRTVSAPDLRSFLEDRVPKWWLPERWAFVEQVPKTSVGKFDKRALRDRYAAGALPVVRI